MHFGASQQTNLVIPEGHAVWAEAYRSERPGHGEARVWVAGYLVPAVQAGAPPGW